MIKKNGFTLIELMIVITIISILITIALPMYFSYVNKANLTSALQLLNQGKWKAEIILSEESRKQFIGPKYLDIPHSSNQCSEILSHILETGQVTISCLLKGNNILQGKIIQLYKLNDQSSWQCQSNASLKFLPKNCIYLEKIIPSTGKD